MKNLKYVIDLISFFCGVPLLVLSSLNSDEEGAAIGAMMITFGLLVRTWRKENALAKKELTNENRQDLKEEPTVLVENKILVTGIALIVAFTFVGSMYKKIHSIDSDVSHIQYIVDNIEYRLRQL